MTPLRGRDGHILVAAEDGDTDRCVRCRRPRSEHATSKLAAGGYTYAGVSQRERDALAAELAPNGLTRLIRLIGGEREL